MADYTVAQEKAINHEGSSALVSASAGSGKTRVMIDRIIKLILQKKAQVNEILAVTFTQLAAKQIKEKLSSALVKSITEENYGYIKEQLNLLRTANISTIHSFCSNVLRTYFYEAGLDANFSIIDEVEAEKLKNQSVNDLFEDKYESGDEDFLSLVKVFSQKRSDNSLKQNVMGIYGFIMDESEPFSTFDKTLHYYDEDGLKEIENKIYNYSIEKIARYFDQLKGFADYFTDNGMPKTDKTVREIIAETDVLLSAKDLPTLVRYAQTATFDTFASDVKKDDDRYAVKAAAMDIKTKLSSHLKWIAGKVGFTFTDDNVRKYLNMKPTLEKYFDLVKEFKQYFDSAKRRENVVDFSDLEHYTYELLKNDEILAALKDSFKYIFIDEYQDVNGVQEAIFSSLSSDNLFMVGDVKQSIYGFRGCNPEFFAQKYDKFLNGEGGEAIFLEENFRSAPEILNTVNKVFNRVMEKDFTGVEYKANPMKYGGLYKNYQGETFIHSVNFDKKKEKPVFSGVYDIEKHLSMLGKSEENKKAQFLAWLIQNEIGKPIYDLKQNRERRITFGDIVILTRDFGKSEDETFAALISYGIPVSTEAKKSISDYPEIKWIVDLLSLIINRAQDIPLVSVMKSPVGNFDNADLIKIRSAYPKEETFYGAFTQYVLNENDSLSEKLKNFNAYMDRIRLLSEYESASEILSRIIVEKNVDTYYLGMPFGEIRNERINLFIQHCDGGKKYGVRELYDRLEYVLKNATISIVGTEDAVKVMTVHASKGLEFPVVILNDCGKRFSLKDKISDIYKERSCGIAFKNYDYEKSTVCDDTPHRLMANIAMTERTIREEMRLLYVALTRAECRLHIVAYNYDFTKQKHVSDFNCFADFVKESDANIMYYENDDYVLGECETQDGARQVIVADYDKNTVDEIYKNLSFKYAYSSDTSLPVKKSVTSALKQEDEYYERTTMFGESDSEVGTAYHKALEIIDFYGDFDKEWQKFLLLADKEQSSLVDKQKLKSILSMPIFAGLDGYKLYKEQPFTVNISAKELLDIDTDRQILVQGIIDLLAVKDGNAVIVDYKHSTILHGKDLIKKYEKQLRLYKTAVEKVLKLKVSECYLVNIYTLKTVKV